MALILLAVLGCGQTTREDLLAGNFGNVDRSPPKPITPDDFRVKGTSSILSWSASAGASRYTVDIAQDASFSQPMAGSPFVSNEASLEVAFADANTYFWRVRANTTEAGRFSDIRKVHVLGGAMRVFCPSTTATCSNAGRYGTKNFPYEVIKDTLAEAKGSGVAVHVAARSGGGANLFYAERITLLEGVSILGGYDGMSWQRDVIANKTEIRHDSDRVLIGDFLAGTADYSIDGFTITSSATSGSPAVIYLQNVSASLTISGNTIQASTAANSPVAISNVSSSPKILRNAIFGGTGASTSVAISNTSGSNPLIANNTIFGGAATIVTTVGISHSWGSSSTILNNTISGGTGNPSYAISIQDTASHPIVENNILFTSGVSVNRYCIYEAVNGAKVGSLQNNNFFDCDQSTNGGFYRPGGSAALKFMCSDGKPGSAGGCSSGNDVAQGTTAGNTVVNNAGGQLFVNLNGPDGLPETITDNDWHLNPAALSICPVLYGARDRSDQLGDDRDKNARSAVLPASGVCLGNVTNSGAAGWSMGAYERD
ncbi:MAG: hypothetical protein OHK0011_15410 [Turneriella sp.]